MRPINQPIGNWEGGWEGGVSGNDSETSSFSPSKLKSLCQDSPSELNIPQLPLFSAPETCLLPGERDNSKTGDGLKIHFLLISGAGSWRGWGNPRMAHF